MALRHAPAILVGRVVRVAARIRKPGGGSAVPGLVVNKLAPGYLAATLNSFPSGLVIVTGSSGKSTTTKMLVAILAAHGQRVFTNPSTANIAQGLTSALLERSTLTGRIDADVAVLEMDEAHAARIAPTIVPRTVVVTNVMVDQIDRFHQPEMVAEMLGRVVARATDSVILNADDPLVAGLSGSAAATARVSTFGAAAELQSDHLGYHAAVGATPAQAAVTSVDGRRATLTIDGHTAAVSLPARGVHYAIDAAAAVSAARAVLEQDFELQKAVEALASITPVFGRGEVVVIDGKAVEFVLVQNPASFQLNVDELDPTTEQVLFAMGSDVRDPSYFWPVDLSTMPPVAYVSGLKASEAALQLAYAGVAVGTVEPDLGVALDAFMALPDPDHGTKIIVFTADSMRRTRAHFSLAGQEDQA